MFRFYDIVSRKQKMENKRKKSGKKWKRKTGKSGEWNWLRFSFSQCVCILSMPAFILYFCKKVILKVGFYKNTESRARARKEGNNLNAYSYFLWM